MTHTVKRGRFRELFGILGKLTHQDLVRQIEYLRVENQILKNKAGKRVHLTPSERRRIMKFGQPLGPSVRKIMSIVTYTAYKGWFNKRRKTKPQKRGRKRTKKEIRDLIIQLARENNWGYTRILGELKKLHIDSLSRNTVKNILKENGIYPAPKRDEDTWDNFIKRHCETLLACDFFTKTAWTGLGPHTFHFF